MFNHIARLASRLTGAEVTLVGVCGPTGVQVLGSDGSSMENLDRKYSLCELATNGLGLVYVGDVRRDPHLRRHPFCVALPTMRRLLYVPIPTLDPHERAGLVIVDPSPQWASNRGVSGLLADLGSVTRAALEMRERPTPKPSLPGLGEAECALDGSSLPLETFLLETLIQKTSIHKLKAFSYVTLRMWRKAIKPHQIAALKALKARPTPGFADAIANEIANHVRAVIGGGAFDSVASVPCGHSQGARCLATMIGEAVGKKLAIPYREVFLRQSRKGSSHPRANKSLEPFSVVEPPFGRVLLVDDVATSGAHMKMAAAKLGASSDTVMAVSWIGK